MLPIRPVRPMGFIVARYAHRAQKLATLSILVHPVTLVTPASLKRSKQDFNRTLRYGQALSGAIRYTQALSKTLYFNLNSTGFKRPKRLVSHKRPNGLISPKRPVRHQIQKRYAQNQA